MKEVHPIRVLLVDDHEMVRKGLKLLLMAFEDLCLVGETGSGQEALQLCSDLNPDVVIMDLVMPDMDGVEATRQIAQNHPQTKVVALTSYREDTTVQRAIQAGAIGYLMKDVSIDELAEAIRNAHAGRPSFDDQALRALMAAATATPSPLGRLTSREAEILTLMMEGLTNPEIAERLMIGRATVKTHVSNILTKLEVKNRLEAVAMAMQTGWGA